MALMPANEVSDDGTSTTNSELDRLAKLEFTTLDGVAVSLGDHRGKPLVVNSWATWCPFCREELPDFVELQNEFGDEVLVIAIDRSESVAKVEEYLTEFNLTTQLEYWQDDGDNFYEQIGGFTMPETLFINSDGEIVVHKRGFMDLNEMREHTNLIVN